MSDLYGEISYKPGRATSNLQKSMGDENPRELEMRDIADAFGVEVDFDIPDSRDGHEYARVTLKDGGVMYYYDPEEMYQDLAKKYEMSESNLDEKRKKKKKKKSGKKDACYHKVKSRYKVWPSAYASGALVKCRKVGAKNWGNSKKEQLQAIVEDELTQVLYEKQLDEGFIDSIMSKFRPEPEVEVEPEEEKEEEKPKRKPYDSDHPDHPDHPDNIRARQRRRQSKKDSDAYYGRTVSDIYGKNYSNRRPKSSFYQYTTEGVASNSLEDIIYYTLFEVLNEKKNIDEDLRKWFGRKGAPGKKKGWVDCNTCSKDKKTGRKKCGACGRSSGEKRSKYPSCRPTPSACGKRGNWGKKSKKGKKG